MRPQPNASPRRFSLALVSASICALLLLPACGAGLAKGGSSSARPSFSWPKEARWTLSSKTEQILFIDGKEHSRTRGTLTSELRVTPARDGLRVEQSNVHTEDLGTSEQHGLQAAAEALGALEIDRKGRFVRTTTNAKNLERIAGGMQQAKDDVDAALRAWWLGLVEDWHGRKLERGALQKLATPRGEVHLRFVERKRCPNADDSSRCVVLERSQRLSGTLGPEGLAATKVLAERGLTLKPIESAVEHRVLSEESTLIPHGEKRRIEVTFQLPGRDGERNYRVVVTSETSYTLAP